MPIKFTPKREEELSRFENLPDGIYPFTVLESAIKLSKSAKNAGKEMVAVKLNVHGPDFDRHVYDYFADWFSEWKLKHFCDTTGLAADYAAGQVDPSDNSWQGRQGYVLIATDDARDGFPAKNVANDYGDGKKSSAPATSKPIVKAEKPSAEPPESDDVPF